MITQQRKGIFAIVSGKRTGLGLAVGLALLAGAGLPARAGDLVVTVKGVHSGAGNVMVALFDKEENYLSQQRLAGQALAARSDSLRAVFPDLPAGRFGVAVFHDENANGTLEFAISGRPVEGVGFSNDAPSPLGMPVFEAIAVAVPATGVTETALTLRY